MANIGISIRIDVTKIDKARIFEGQKGKYLDLTTFIDMDNPDQYGNHGFISQSVTKEERDQKVQTKILGNSKVFYGGGNQQQSRSPQPASPSAGPDYGSPQGGSNWEDDVPFASHHKNTIA